MKLISPQKNDLTPSIEPTMELHEAVYHLNEGAVGAWIQQYGSIKIIQGLGLLKTPSGALPLLHTLMLQISKSKLENALFRGLNIANMLIKNGVDIDELDMSCQTPLYIACSREIPAMLNLLLSHQANPNIQGGCQLETPLYVLKKKEVVYEYLSLNQNELNQIRQMIKTMQDQKAYMTLNEEKELQFFIQRCLLNKKN